MILMNTDAVYLANPVDVPNAQALELPFILNAARPFIPTATPGQFLIPL